MDANEEYDKLNVRRRVAKGQITRTLNALERLVKVESRPELIGRHVDTLVTYRDKAAECCDRMSELRPDMLEEIEEWLSAEFDRIADVVDEAETSISERVNHVAVGVGGKVADATNTATTTACAVGAETYETKPVGVVFHAPDMKLRRTSETPVRNHVTQRENCSPVAGRGRLRFNDDDCDYSDSEVSQRFLPPNTSSPFTHGVSYHFGKSLPKLSLPNFEGDPLKWVDWFGLFTAMIDSTPMSEIEKMTHLQHSCTGRAKDEIAGFGYNGCFYRDALDALKERFGKRQFVIRANLERLSKVSSVNENRNTLYKLAAIVRGVVVTFKNLGYSADLDATSNCDIVVEKLSDSLKLKWAQYLVKYDIEQPSLRTVHGWLQEVVRAYELLPPSKSKVVLNETAHVTTENYVAPQTPKNEKCPLGDGNHALAECAKFCSMSVDKRVEVVKKHKLCFVCFGYNHWVRKCRSPRCGQGSCKANHHMLLHRDVPAGSSVAGPETQHAYTTTELKKPVILQVLPVTLQSPSGKVDTHAMLDLGSTCSLMLKNVADQLGLQGESQQLHLSGIREQNLLTSQKVSVDVKSNQSVVSYKVNNVWVIDELNLPVVNIDMSLEKSRWVHLKDLDLPNVKGKQVTLLLGSDAIDIIKPLEVRSGPVGAPHAINTALGWTTVGPVPGIKGFLSENVCLTQTPSLDEELNNLVKSWWTTESFGCAYDVQQGQSKEDKRAIEILEATTKKVGNRFETGLLWRDNDLTLPSNRPLAEKRLESLERRLDRDPVLKQAYEKTLLGDVEKGFARPLLPEEIDMHSSRQWFLPHQPVLNPNKPGKVRRVFDAAARYQGVSLNDCLITGPNLLNSLIGVLFRFREEPVAIAADIEAMYSQVLVPQSDQPALRFLWRAKKFETPQVYQYQRHIFGATSSPTSAIYALNSTATDQLEKYPDAAQAVLRDFYMDDCLHSVGGVAKAIKIQRDLVAMLATGGFHLTKWLSNAKGVLDHIPASELAPACKEISDGRLINRVLGVKWDVTTDSFIFDLNFDEVKCRSSLSVRDVLSTMSKVFDPLGFIAPVLLDPKLLMQDIWRKKMNWDDQISVDQYGRFMNWLYNLDEIKNLSVPRFYRDPEMTDWKVQLHTCVDASEMAFSAAVFFRFESSEGRVCSRFVYGRSRVAPIKPLTIPKLELQAALLGARIGKTVLEETRYNIQEIHFWTDSSTVLQWLKSTKTRHPTFVASRVAEILDLFKPSQWHHIPGKLNVADDGSRGLSAEKVTDSCRWLNGPAFLLMPREMWPELELPQVSQETLETVCIQSDDNQGLNDEPLIDVERFSSWSKLWRTTCWLRRFVNNCRKPKSDRRVGQINVDEKSEAESLLIAMSQEEAFAKEVRALKLGKDIPSHSRLRKLAPFLDSEGLLRSRGRIGRSTFQYSTKYPIILCPKSHVTKLIITEAHRRDHYATPDQLRNELRDRYWILKARSTIRKIIHRCMLCRLRNAVSRCPIMADLPEVRVRGETPLFNVTGIDYFGPLLVRKFRKVEKRYGCLFVCLATKAIHVEIAHSLNTDSFLMAVRRFIARRGKPREVYSDNGSNFKAGERELKECIMGWNRQEISDTLLQENIAWHFGPPTGAHFQGQIEILVKSVKRSMNCVLRNQVLSDEVLTTVATETECLVNSRPLTPVSDDINDVEALTPNHFLLKHSCQILPPGVFYDSETSSRRRWRQAQAITEQLWKRWKQEYVRFLMERQKWMKPQKNLKVGDLVLVAEDSGIPRGNWLLGRIMKLYPGSDGVVRVVDLKTKFGVYKRPVVKLLFLLNADE